MNHTIRIKICGITRLQDLQASIQYGADAVGFVFYAPSPRSISIDQAKQLSLCVPPYVQIVGLFVNAKLEDIQEVLDHVPLDIIQFHGDETPEQCHMIASTVGRRWYKALQIHDDLKEQDLLAQIQHYQQAGASAVLLDAYHPQLKGGTGQQFNWDKFPQSSMPLILAGGLTADNVKHAILKTKPYAVDVSGGVESAKGIKDADKLFRFISQVKYNGDGHSC